MSDQKENLLQKLFDPQISTQGHDKIVVWLYDFIKNYKDKNKIFKLPETAQFQELSIRLEYPLTKWISTGRRSGSERVIGFVDLAVFPKYKDISYVVPLFFEVKTKVNIGETMRQINYYKMESGNLDVEWVVCAPPFNESALLLQQGIRFLPYPGAL